MHKFTELIDRCVTFTIETLREVNDRVSEELQTSGTTRLVKTLQMVRLQKAILIVGMFSMFEANLQDSLDCDDGFKCAKEILTDRGQSADFDIVINLNNH